MKRLRVRSRFNPAGDQPQSIERLAEGFLGGIQCQTLKGVTGSGKTFTLAKVIERLQKPTLVVSHNKALAAQLYHELKEFFPDNAVEYFVSYYDYYQPEAYLPSRDLYIEKDASRNEELDRLRLSATTALIDREDVIVVATVSCIYSLGNPNYYRSMRLSFSLGQELSLDNFLRLLIDIQYERKDLSLERGFFRVRGETVEIFPCYQEEAIRIEWDWDRVGVITLFHPLTGKIVETPSDYHLYPNKHFVLPREKMVEALSFIRQELEERVAFFRAQGKVIEAERLKSKTSYDLEMMEMVGYCPGIENYARYLSHRLPGQRPDVLLDYFPKNFLVCIDESHVTLPQIRAMYEGDRSRKQTLINFGFRLPSALDNRPLTYKEFETLVPQALYISATPGPEEERRSRQIVRQMIRPTGLVDPTITVKSTQGQIEDLYEEIGKTTSQRERVLITTLTKKMAENLSDYLQNLGLKVAYLHSEIKTLERLEILKKLREGTTEILVGINLLREGLDLPEVSLIAILDADKIGFLRSATSLIQTIGRAARNVNGRVIMYADKISSAMREAIAETEERRALQLAHNKENNIVPRTIQKSVSQIIQRKQEGKKMAQKMELMAQKGRVNLLDIGQRKLFIKALEKEMFQKAKQLEYEAAGVLRDEIKRLKGGLSWQD